MADMQGIVGTAKPASSSEQGGYAVPIARTPVFAVTFAVTHTTLHLLGLASPVGRGALRRVGGERSRCAVALARAPAALRPQRRLSAA